MKKERKSVALDSSTLLTIETYMSQHKVSFSEALRKLVMQNNDDVSTRLDRLINQTETVVNNSKQTNKFVTTFEQKADERLSKIEEKFSEHAKTINELVGRYNALVIKVKEDKLKAETR